MYKQHLDTKKINDLLRPYLKRKAEYHKTSIHSIFPDVSSVTVQFKNGECYTYRYNRLLNKHDYDLLLGEIVHENLMYKGCVFRVRRRLDEMHNSRR